MKSSVTRNLVLGGIAAACIAIAAWRFFQERNAGALPSEYTVKAVCMTCRAEVECTQTLRTRPPLPCPKCSAKTAVPWFYCPDCKKRYVPRFVKGEDGVVRMPIVPACSGCGSARGQPYEPNDPEHKPTGDVPPPALP